MTTLHLGVEEKPYRSRDKKNRALTTFDVAKILEAKYGIMATYYRVHGQEIADAITNSLAGAIESLAMGQAVDPWNSGMGKVEERFRLFITSLEAERGGIPGTPTKAALAGVNHRLKHPYAKDNPRRPSFWDTGIYTLSFRAWVD